jgi:hypothetical protein
MEVSKLICLPAPSDAYANPNSTAATPTTVENLLAIETPPFPGLETLRGPLPQTSTLPRVSL